MKKLSLTTLLIIITLGFTSCTQEDTTILEEPSAEALLKSFTLGKDSKGTYSLDYNLNQGASSENIKDTKTNTNNIYLYSSEYQSSSRVGQDMTIQNGELKVTFNDTETEKKSTITVLDDDIKMSRDENENLESYGITGNGDGTYDLDFAVVSGVTVDFIYDGDRDVYEVHLNADTNASQSDFTQTFTKEEGTDLSIEFINHSSSSSRDNTTTKPKVVIRD